MDTIMEEQTEYQGLSFNLEAATYLGVVDGEDYELKEDIDIDICNKASLNSK